jgi:ribonuclease HI
MKSQSVYLYTDGSSLGNPGPGGYGIILEWVGMHYKKEFAQGYKRTTNNRMELLAVIIGLEKLKKTPLEIVVYSDSKYVVDAVEKKWVFNWEKKNFKDKKNKDLWLRFLKVYRKHKVHFEWIKGHNNHPQNERCDLLAVQAAKSENLLSDVIYEQVEKENTPPK